MTWMLCSVRIWPVQSCVLECLTKNEMQTNETLWCVYMIRKRLCYRNVQQHQLFELYMFLTGIVVKDNDL